MRKAEGGRRKTSKRKDTYISSRGDIKISLREMTLIGEPVSATATVICAPCAHVLMRSQALYS